MKINKKYFFTLIILTFIFATSKVNALNLSDGLLILEAGDVSCGTWNNIPGEMPSIFHFFVNLIKVITPVGLIIKGMVDMFKAVTAQKEDGISKAKNKFFKRLIAAAIVFLVIAIPQTLFGIVGNAEESSTVSKCVDCFLNNDCSANFDDNSNLGTDGDTSTTGGSNANGSSTGGGTR